MTLLGKTWKRACCSKNTLSQIKVQAAEPAILLILQLHTPRTSFARVGRMVGCSTQHPHVHNPHHI